MQSLQEQGPGAARLVAEDRECAATPRGPEENTGSSLQNCRSPWPRAGVMMLFMIQQGTSNRKRGHPF